MAMTSEGNKARLMSRSSVPIICKFIELCLSIVIVGLIVDPTNNGVLAFDQNHSGIVYVSWPGYIIINTILIITHLAGDRVPKRTQILFSLVGGCLFVAAAGVSLEDWRRQHGGTLIQKNVQQYSDQTIAAGILALFCALTFFIDVFLTLMLFSLVGGVLYVAASGVAIHDWRKNRMRTTALHTSKQYQDMTISAGTLGLLTALVMFAEVYFLMLEDDDDD